MLRDQGYRAGAPLAKQGGLDLSATSISSPLAAMAQGSSFSSTGAGSGSFQPNLFEGAALHQLIFDTLVETGVRMPPTREPLASIRTPNDLYERLLYIAEPRVPHGDKPMLLSRTGEFRIRGEVPTWRETERIEEVLKRVERFFDRFDDRLRELDKTRPLSVHTFFQTYCAYADISTALIDFGRKHLPEGSDVREAIEAHEGTAAWYMRTGLRYEAARRLSGNSHFLPESIRSGLTHYVEDLNLDHDGDNTSLALTEHIQLCIEREKEASRLFCNYVKDNPTSELATVIAAAAGNSLWKGMTPSDDMKSTLFRTYSNALHMSLNRTQSGFVRVSEDQLNLMAGIAELQPDEWKRRIGLEIQRGNWAVEGRVFATGALAAGTGVDRQTRHGMVTMLLSQWDDVLDNFGTAKPIPVQKLPDPLCTFLSTPISQSSVPVDQQFLSRLSKGGGFADRYMDLRIEADREQVRNHHQPMTLALFLNDILSYPTRGIVEVCEREYRRDVLTKSLEEILYQLDHNDDLAPNAKQPTAIDVVTHLVDLSISPMRGAQPASRIQQVAERIREARGQGKDVHALRRALIRAGSIEQAAGYP